MTALHVCVNPLILNTVPSSTVAPPPYPFAWKISSFLPPLSSLMARILDSLPRPSQLSRASTLRTDPPPFPCRINSTPVSLASTRCRPLCSHGETTVTLEIQMLELLRAAFFQFQSSCSSWYCLILLRIGKKKWAWQIWWMSDQHSKTKAPRVNQT